MAILNSINLSGKTCMPIVPGTKPLNNSETAFYLKLLNPRWKIVSNILTANFVFLDFNKAMEFVNKIASLANQNYHHPDINIKYNIVCIFLYTHSIAGLSENDFILASKIDILI